MLFMLMMIPQFYALSRLNKLCKGARKMYMSLSKIVVERPSKQRLSDANIACDVALLSDASDVRLACQGEHRSAKEE